MVTIDLVAFEKILEIVQLWLVLSQRPNNALDFFYSQILHVLIKITSITILMPKFSKFSMESYVLAVSHFWLCSKRDQGQLKVIIWTIFLVLRYPMLYTKFQGHQSTGSGGEDF